ncbi:MAG: hypothetical protein KF905_15660 [Flavobacteriales bacterium]|nr:hypothetical protein [Flavobacteriales bacterium]
MSRNAHFRMHGPIGALTALLLVLASGVRLHGQWTVPVKLELSGTLPEQRQVSGLAMPDATDAGVSLDAERTQYTSTSSTSGSQVLSALLVPAPTAYQSGMTITVIPTEAHEAGASITLNGLSPQPLHARNGAPVMAGELPVGVPSRLVFDGNAFVVLGTVGTACPEGYSAVGSSVCIADSSAAPRNFFEANLYCRQQQARLCSFGEWVAACRADAAFFTTVPSAEWVDHAANLTETAKTVGHGQDGTNVPPGAGCNFGGYGTAASDNYRVRCCKDR